MDYTKNSSDIKTMMLTGNILSFGRRGSGAQKGSFLFLAQTRNRKSKPLNESGLSGNR